MLRKGNGRNPRVDGSARWADDRFGDDDRPLNKSYETQTQVPTVAKHQPDQTIAAVLELLAETWPKCFSIYEARRQPLKVGVHHDILAALDGAVTAAELSRALRVYTGNKVYRSRVRPGAMRIGLDGEPSRRHLAATGPTQRDRRRRPRWSAASGWTATAVLRESSRRSGTACRSRRIIPSRCRPEAARLCPIPTSTLSPLMFGQSAIHTGSKHASGFAQTVSSGQPGSKLGGTARNFRDPQNPNLVRPYL